MQSLRAGVLLANTTEQWTLKWFTKIEQVPTQYCGDVLIELPYRNLLSIVLAIEEFACT